VTVLTIGSGSRAGVSSWRLLAARSVLVAYLFYVVQAIGHHSHGAAAVAGYAILAAFTVGWLVIPVPGWMPFSGGSTRLFWVLYAVMAGLFVAELPFARALAFVMAVLITIPIVARLGTRSAPVVIALTAASLLVPVAIPSWHVSLTASWDTATPIAIPVAALVTFVVHQTLTSSHALAEARADLACLAAENERFRIARDLHDLLGHSLTTITVKAGLAARLGPSEHDRAAREMAEVEHLARQALDEVRAAVAGYREVTLASELATGRQLLRAAGITADLPHAVDDVDPAHQELFGWVVREGLTNIVRHSRATACAVRLSASAIEITDNGVGGSALAANGLTGLRERVTAAGGSIDAGPGLPAGWRLRVCLLPGGGTA
jgi:two-component system, NarL family, sensor histidine kinase DesK